MHYKFSRLFSSLVILVILSLTLTSVGPVYAVTGNERFHVQLTRNNVEGYDWTVGVSVTLTIDDPGTGPNPDFTDVQTVESNGIVAFNDVGGINLAPGMYVTMSDGTTTKDHTVTPLSVSDIDVDNDTLSGTSAPLGYVRVASFDCGGAVRNTDADGSGNWSVDFSVPGTLPEEQTLCDIVPGSSGKALEPDGDSDHTDVDWRIPNPQISAHPQNDEVVGWDFLFGVTIILNIDDPGTGTNPDYTDTTTSGAHPENPDMSWFSFNFSGAYDLKPGDIVTVTDGTDTKNHVVTPVAVTSADAAADTVSGSAVVATYVYTEICDESACYYRNELVDGSGDWVADFSTPGDEPGEAATYDLQRGDSGVVIQWDSDGDETIISWRILNPVVMARANQDSLEGWDWPVGPTLTIDIDDPGTGPGSDYSTTTTAIVAPWDPSQTYFSLDLNGSYDLKAGDEVSVTDGSTTKVLIITGLQITDIDPDTDVVTGVAPPGSEVNIWACWDGGCTDSRVETADGSGDWSTDFSDGGGGQPTYDIQPGDWVDSGQWDPDDDGTNFGINVTNPRIEARTNDERVDGFEWDVGVSVTLEIDDPDNGVGVDFTDTKTVEAAPWDPSQTYVEFHFEGAYDLQSGDAVSLTDGSTTKELIVTPLEITDIDPDTDVVTGVAAPGSDVEIWACDGDFCSGNRVATANGSGDWSTDFSDGGGGQPTYDIVFGTWIDSGQWDVDGDGTYFGVNVPNYTLHAVPSYPEVHGHDWPSGASVTMYVDDDDSIGNGTLYTDTKLASSGGCGEPCFDLNGIFDLQVGHYVTFTDGSVTKVVQISVLHVTGIDTVNETISGMADPGSDVMVNIHSQDGNTRHVVAAGDGSWTVDYSVPGDEDFEGDTSDLEPGDNGRAIQLNPDGSDDGTLEYWEIPNPTVVAQYPSNLVTGREWEYGASVTLEVDDPGNGPGVDFSDTQTVGWAPFNPSLTYVEFDIGSSLTLGPGLQLSLTDGTTTKEHTTLNLTVTSVDMASDVITGTADPGAELDVFLLGAGGGHGRHEQADGSGNWSADFSVPGDEDWENNTYDINFGDFGTAVIYDSDSDQTRYYWYAPSQNVEARTNDERVEGYEWDLGVSVTLEIDDPDNGPGVDYTDTKTVGTAPGDPSRTYVEFSFAGTYDLQPGDEVSLTDGSMTKYLTVTELQITDIDPDTDVVTGVAPPGSEVNIWACWDGGCTDSRVATADGSGNWSTDFSDGGGGQPTHDIVRGTWVDSGQWDYEGDATLYGENVPNPRIVAQYPSNLVIGREWEYGDSITLEVDDPGNGPGVDFTDTQTVGWAPFNPSLTYVEFDIGSSLTLGPGLQLSMTDGIVTKEHTTLNLAVTSVDMASDVITGTSDPGADINIYILGTSVGRNEQADGSGNWSADFSVPGDEDWENNTYDIQSTDFGIASIFDSDDDQTRYYWYAPPIVSSITRAGPSPTSASSVDYTVTFAEEVTGVTADDFTFHTTGSITGYSVTGVSGSGDTYTVTVATGIYNGTLRLDVKASGTGIQDLNGADLEGGFTSGEAYAVTKTYTKTFKSKAKYDGWILESTEFSDKGGNKNKLGNKLNVGDNSADKQYRAILSFGTGKIPDNAVITKVVLKVKKAGVVGTNPMNTHNGLVVDIKKGKFYTKFALQINDFQAAASKLNVGKFSKKLYSGWYKAVLYTGARAYINKTGITQFRLRFLLDDNDDFGADILKLYSGNAGLANRPQLIVTYYVP